ncbi:MAG: DNA-binding transcriptional regulator BolA [Candidatus Erwinia impunctatus]|nr:DNA-binding transcriptional regulator BolA [Culicoides impunctatus]
MIKQQIEKQLEQSFAPVYLEIQNESHQHNVAVGAETHFKVIMVSEAFEADRLLARHRRVYTALARQMAAGVHALALHLYTREEWDKKQSLVPDSPPCRGGSSH